jgi:TPP-dependent 2-oxoacid decarboxylase
VFGVPGDYALRLLDLIEESDMDLVDMRHVSDQVRFSP